MSLFSFFKRMVRPAKKDFDWFFARLLNQATEGGWNEGYPLPDVDLVCFAEETSHQVEKGVCEACRKAGVSISDADVVLIRVMRTCFFAGLAAWRHWNRNRKAARKAGIYQTITHSAGVGRLEPYALGLMGLNDRSGSPTPKGRDLAAFAGAWLEAHGTKTVFAAASLGKSC